jgi:hypothetical protein
VGIQKRMLDLLLPGVHFTSFQVHQLPRHQLRRPMEGPMLPSLRSTWRATGPTFIQDPGCQTLVGGDHWLAVLI